MPVQNKQGVRVLVTGSLLQLFLGILYVWSVFVKPVSEIYIWDTAGVKLTSSFMLCFFVVGILAGGKALAKTGSQKIILAGGLMLSAGMLMTGLLPASAAPFMYVTYGVIGGFGVGTAYNAIITAAQKWFPQKRGLATGIPVCAFGFSTVIFAPLIETLIGQFGLRNTFMILAAVFFAVTAILFSFIKMPDENTSAGTPSAALLAKKQFTVTEAMKTKEFYFITLSIMFSTAAFFILNPSFKSFAAERGLNESAGTMIVMLTGVANALGRLGAPLLSDKLGREKAALLIITATSVCALILIYAGGGVFMAAVAVTAFCYGGFSGIYPVLTADYFGIKNVGSNYGAVMTGFAISALTFPMIISLVNNVTIKFIILASLAAVAAVLMLLLMKSGKQRMEQK